MVEYSIKLADTNETLKVYETGLLGEYSDIVARINTSNGWFDSERTFGDDIALLHSEVSEAFEAFRATNPEAGITWDPTVWICTSKNFGGKIVDHDLDLVNGGHICKPEGVGSELADVLVRLLDTVYRCNINLEHEFLRKLQYNATRGYRHGNKAV